MHINCNWLDEWRCGDSHVLLGYDDDYEYRLRCDQRGGELAVRIEKVEGTSDER